MFDNSALFKRFVCAIVVLLALGRSAAAQEPITLEHKDWVRCVAISPDGKLLASGDRRSVGSLGIGARGAFYLWDLEKKQKLTTSDWYPDHKRSLVFSPDGKTIALEDGQSIRLWDVASRQTKTTLNQHTVYATVSGMKYSPDGKVLAVTFDSDIGWRGKNLRIWDLTGKPNYRNLHGHKKDISSLALAPDGKTLVTSSFDKTVRLWDTETWKTRTILTPEQGVISLVRYSPDGQKLLLVGADRQLWDVAKAKPVLTFEIEKKRGSEEFFNDTWDATFAPDGKLLATIAMNIVYLWDTTTGKLLARFVGSGNGMTVAIVFTPDGKKLAVACTDSHVRLWDVNQVLKQNAEP